MDKIHTFSNKIIPDKLICNSNLYKIIVSNKSYFINKFEVITNMNDEIKKIIIPESNHPNCDPESKEFCIPQFIKQMKLNNETINIIENMFKIFNFDSAFYQPWNDFEYVKDEDENKTRL